MLGNEDDEGAGIKCKAGEARQGMPGHRKKNDQEKGAHFMGTTEEGSGQHRKKATKEGYLSLGDHRGRDKP